jgi:outer membrane protein OmpA-like peptidoglycan-associated protein
VALAGVLLASVPAASQSDVTPQALDINFGIVDILVGVESLDSSVADVESATQVETTLAADVLFAFNQANLTPAAAATLAQVANDVKARAKGEVRIDGYTDAVGDDAYNLDLSRRRAASVQAALQPLLAGAPVTLRVTGHGEANPVAPNNNPDGSDNPGGRAKNRRVTIGFEKR